MNRPVNHREEKGQYKQRREYILHKLKDKKWVYLDKQKIFIVDPRYEREFLSRV